MVPCFMGKSQTVSKDAETTSKQALVCLSLLMSSKRASGSKSVVKPKPQAAGGKRPNSKFRNDFKMPKLSGKKPHKKGVEKR